MNFLNKLLCATAATLTLAGIVCLAVLEGERSNPNLPGLILLVLGIFIWLPLFISGFKVGGDGGGQPRRAKVNQATVRRNRIFKYLCLVAGGLILSGLVLGRFIQDGRILTSLICGGFFFFAFSFIWWVEPGGGGG